VLTITVPPLRQRVDDIPGLVRELLSRVGERMGLVTLPTVDSAAMDALVKYDWPGNIRELQNVLERALILCDRYRIAVRDLGLDKFGTRQSVSSGEAPAEPLSPHGNTFDEAVNETKRLLIVRALDRTRGSVKEAAALLGMTRNSIDHHIRRLRIRRPSSDTESSDSIAHSTMRSR